MDAFSILYFKNRFGLMISLNAYSKFKTCDVIGKLFALKKIKRNGHTKFFFRFVYQNWIKFDTKYPIKFVCICMKLGFVLYRYKNWFWIAVFLWYIIYIFDSDLIWRMQLLIIRG